MTRSRNWCFTDFNLNDWEDIYNRSKKIRFIGYELERCPDSGKPHYQGFVQFETCMRLSEAKKHLEDKTIHIEIMKGNLQQNIKYCSKDKNYKSYGKFISQGQRMDLENVINEINTKNMTKSEVIETFPVKYIMYKNGLNAIIEHNEQKSRQKIRDIEVIVYSGKTGTGKTYKAVTENPEAYIISNLKWWNGYNGEKVIIIDEYNNDIPCTEMIRLLDRYPLRLEVKGNHTYANWHKVIITTNLQKHEFHESAKEEHRNALFRRISEWVDFDTKWYGNTGVPLLHPHDIM